MEIDTLEGLAARLNELDRLRTSHEDYAINDVLSILYRNLDSYKAQLSKGMLEELSYLEFRLGQVELNPKRPSLSGHMHELHALGLVDIELRDTRFYAVFTYAGEVLSRAIRVRGARRP